MWRVEFDENGGYDCMSAAFILKKGTGTNAEQIVIDGKDFDWGRFWYKPGKGTKERMLLIANTIAETLNEKGL